MSAVSLTYGRREWTIELLLLLAEGMLVWLVASIAFAPFSSLADPVPLWLAIGLVAVAGILPRLLHDRGIWGASFSAVLAGAIALTTLAAIKTISFPGLPWLDTTWPREAVRSLVFEDSGADIAVWAPIGLSAVVWWLTRFNGSPGLDRSRGMLRTGAAVTAVLTIASALVEPGPNDRAITLSIVIFFASTLIALAIARQGSEATHSRRRLASTVVLPTIVIVAVASLFALLVTFDWRSASPDSLSFVGTVLDPVFKLLMLVLTGLVIVISLPILWLFSLGNFRTPQVQPFSQSGQDSAAQSAIDWQPPDPVRYLLAAIFLVLIFYGVARFGLALTRRDFDASETGEREFGSGKGLSKWLDRLRWPFGRGGGDPLAGLRGDPVWANTVRVRETYASWLRWAEERKAGRGFAETALELDHRSGVWLHSPASVAALDELTSIYDHVRYSQTPATVDQADRAARAWNQLKSLESAATS